MSDRLSRKRNKDQHSHGSRDSSTSSSVRCGCQYFQTDSLLPEKQSLLGIKPNITTIMNTMSKNNDILAPIPTTTSTITTTTTTTTSFSDKMDTNNKNPTNNDINESSTSTSNNNNSTKIEKTNNNNSKIGDHDYEPITPMSTSRPTPPPILKVSNPSAAIESTSNDTKTEKPKIAQFLKIPKEDEVLQANDENQDEDEEGVEYEEEYDEEIEEEEELSEDQDSFEDEEEEDDEEMTAEELQARMEERFFNQAPIQSVEPSKVRNQGASNKEPSRSSMKNTPQAQTFKQKMQNQAGKLKTTIQTMSKRKDAPKSNEGLEGEPSTSKSKFQFPKRPKFDRSKFKMPNRPNIKLPDRPKFSLPDRAKFKMPDRSKFKLPDRPKINLPTLRLPKRSNSFKEGERGATSTMGSKKNLFDFKTYPRIFNKRKIEESNEPQQSAQHLTPTESIPTSSSAPSTPIWKRMDVSKKWGTMISELKTKQHNKKMKTNDENLQSHSSDKSYPPLSESGRSKTRSASSGLDTDKEQHSSGASSLRDRKGVLEEINSDEFFLREKGLSRDNVDVSQFLTREIRDAFKADKEESEFEDEESPEEEVPEPKERTPPQRSKSFSRFIGRFQKKDKKELEEKKDLYKTYPPRKERKRKDSELFLIIPLKDENDPDYQPSMPFSDHTDEDYEVQRQIFKAVSKPKIDVVFNVETKPQEVTVDKQAPNKQANDLLPQTVTKTTVTTVKTSVIKPTTVTTTDAKKENKENVAPKTEVVTAQVEDFPSAPRRRKSISASLKSEGILRDVDSNKENRSLKSETEVDKISLADPEPQQLNQFPTPTAPRRRSRSLGTSLTSEDRTSRGADSMPSEEHDDTCDYAIVDKSAPPVTPPRSRPPRPPPPCRRRRTFNLIRDQGLSYFFTVPRRKSYVEEMPTTERSYSTLGPTRPPRRGRGFREPVYASGSIQSDIGYIDNESETRSINQHIPDFIEDLRLDNTSFEDKDLQSDDVIEKMKGRPLPAPPRPPRKTKSEGGDDSDLEDIEMDARIAGNTPPINDITLNLNTEDVSIAIQTDPLSDDYVVTNNIDMEDDQTMQDKSTRVVPLKGERKSLTQNKKTNEDVQQNEFTIFDAPTLPLRRDRSTSKKSLNTEPSSETMFSNLPSTEVNKILNTTQPIEEPRVQASAFTTIGTGSLPHRSQLSDNIGQSASTLPRESTNSLRDSYFSQSQDIPKPPPRNQSSSPPKPPSRQKDPDNNNGSDNVEQTAEKIVERQVIVVPGPEGEIKLLKAQRLQVDELDVNRINVNDLQASKITVHDIDSDTINVSRINSNSGNLVIDNIELPSDILQSISQSIRGAISFSSATMPSQQNTTTATEQTESLKQEQSAQATPVQQSTQSQTQPTPSTHESTQTKQDNKSEPTRPDRQRNADYAVPIPKYIRGRKFSYDSEEDLMILPIPLPRSRRRHQDDPSTSSRSQETCSDPTDDSAIDLGRRLVNVIGSDIANLIQSVLQHIPRGEKQQQRDTVQMFICIFVTIFALFFLLGFGSGTKTIHTHHWDYQFPPPPP